ncbi:Ras-specific guanine nucleotide-releasing factor RalGPS1, partial [Galemys pyrenaicus]
QKRAGQHEVSRALGDPFSVTLPGLLCSLQKRQSFPTASTRASVSAWAPAQSGNVKWKVRESCSLSRAGAVSRCLPEGCAMERTARESAGPPGLELRRQLEDKEMAGGGRNHAWKERASGGPRQPVAILGRLGSVEAPLDRLWVEGVPGPFPLGGHGRVARTEAPWPAVRDCPGGWACARSARGGKKPDDFMVRKCKHQTWPEIHECLLVVRAAVLTACWGDGRWGDDGQGRPLGRRPRARLSDMNVESELLVEDTRLLDDTFSSEALCLPAFPCAVDEVERTGAPTYAQMPPVQQHAPRLSPKLPHFTEHPTLGHTPPPGLGASGLRRDQPCSQLPTVPFQTPGDPEGRERQPDLRSRRGGGCVRPDGGGRRNLRRRRLQGCPGLAWARLLGRAVLWRVCACSVLQRAPAACRPPLVLQTRDECGMRLRPVWLGNKMGRRAFGAGAGEAPKDTPEQQARVWPAGAERRRELRNSRRGVARCGGLERASGPRHSRAVGTGRAGSLRGPPPPRPGLLSAGPALLSPGLRPRLGRTPAARSAGNVAPVTQPPSLLLPPTYRSAAGALASWQGYPQACALDPAPAWRARGPGPPSLPAATLRRSDRTRGPLAGPAHPIPPWPRGEVAAAASSASAHRLRPLLRTHLQPLPSWAVENSHQIVTSTSSPWTAPGSPPLLGLPAQPRDTPSKHLQKENHCSFAVSREVLLNSVSVECQTLNSIPSVARAPPTAAAGLPAQCNKLPLGRQELAAGPGLELTGSRGARSAQVVSPPVGAAWCVSPADLLWLSQPPGPRLALARLVGCLPRPSCSVSTQRSTLHLPVFPGKLPGQNRGCARARACQGDAAGTERRGGRGSSPRGRQADFLLALSGRRDDQPLQGDVCVMGIFENGEAWGVCVVSEEQRQVVQAQTRPSPTHLALVLLWSWLSLTRIRPQRAAERPEPSPQLTVGERRSVPGRPSTQRCTQGPSLVHPPSMWRRDGRGAAVGLAWPPRLAVEGVLRLPWLLPAQLVLIKPAAQCEAWKGGAGEFASPPTADSRGVSRSRSRVTSLPTADGLSPALFCLLGLGQGCRGAGPPGASCPPPASSLAGAPVVQGQAVWGCLHRGEAWGHLAQTLAGAITASSEGPAPCLAPRRPPLPPTQPGSGLCRPWPWLLRLGVAPLPWPGPSPRDPQSRPRPLRPPLLADGRPEAAPKPPLLVLGPVEDPRPSHSLPSVSPLPPTMRLGKSGFTREGSGPGSPQDVHLGAWSGRGAVLGGLGLAGHATAKRAHGLPPVLAPVQLSGCSASLAPTSCPLSHPPLPCALPLPLPPFALLSHCSASVPVGARRAVSGGKLPVSPRRCPPLPSTWLKPSPRPCRPGEPPCPPPCRRGKPPSPLPVGRANPRAQAAALTRLPRQAARGKLPLCDHVPTAGLLAAAAQRHGVGATVRVLLHQLHPGLPSTLPSHVSAAHVSAARHGSAPGDAPGPPAALSPRASPPWTLRRTVDKPLSPSRVLPAASEVGCWSPSAQTSFHHSRLTLGHAHVHFLNSCLRTPESHGSFLRFCLTLHLRPRSHFLGLSLAPLAQTRGPVVGRLLGCFWPFGGTRLGDLALAALQVAPCCGSAYRAAPTPASGGLLLGCQSSSCSPSCFRVELAAPVRVTRAKGRSVVPQATQWVVGWQEPPRHTCWSPDCRQLPCEVDAPPLLVGVSVFVGGSWEKGALWPVSGEPPTCFELDTVRPGVSGPVAGRPQRTLSSLLRPGTGLLARTWGAAARGSRAGAPLAPRRRWATAALGAPASLTPPGPWAVGGCRAGPQPGTFCYAMAQRPREPQRGADPPRPERPRGPGGTESLSHRPCACPLPLCGGRRLWPARTDVGLKLTVASCVEGCCQAPFWFWPADFGVPAGCRRWLDSVWTWTHGWNWAGVCDLQGEGWAQKDAGGEGRLRWGWGRGRRERLQLEGVWRSERQPGDKGQGQGRGKAGWGGWGPGAAASVEPGAELNSAAPGLQKLPARRTSRNWKETLVLLPSWALPLSPRGRRRRQSWWQRGRRGPVRTQAVASGPGLGGRSPAGPGVTSLERAPDTAALPQLVPPAASEELEPAQPRDPGALGRGCGSPGPAGEKMGSLAPGVWGQGRARATPRDAFLRLHAERMNSGKSKGHGHWPQLLHRSPLSPVSDLPCTASQARLPGGLGFRRVLLVCAGNRRGPRSDCEMMTPVSRGGAGGGSGLSCEGVSDRGHHRWLCGCASDREATALRERGAMRASGWLQRSGVQELASCGWSKKEKHSLAPNVVAFTRRFNQVSFWVVREILTAQTLKIRAEILSHFVKIAKKLLELNNLHSLMSVVSALQSAPIFRLTKTWALLNRKDKTTFEKLDYLMSKEDNYKRTREYIRSLKMVPSIPYLETCSVPNKMSLVSSGHVSGRSVAMDKEAVGGFLGWERLLGSPKGGKPDEALTLGPTCLLDEWPQSGSLTLSHVALRPVTDLNTVSCLFSPLYRPCSLLIACKLQRLPTWGPPLRSQVGGHADAHGPEPVPAWGAEQLRGRGSVRARLAERSPQFTSPGCSWSCASSRPSECSRYPVSTQAPRGCRAHSWEVAEMPPGPDSGLRHKNSSPSPAPRLPPPAAFPGRGFLRGSVWESPAAACVSPAGPCSCPCACGTPLPLGGLDHVVHAPIRTAPDTHRSGENGRLDPLSALRRLRGLTVWVARSLKRRRQNPIPGRPRPRLPGLLARPCPVRLQLRAGFLLKTQPVRDGFVYPRGTLCGRGWLLGRPHACLLLGCRAPTPCGRPLPPGVSRLPLCSAPEPLPHRILPDTV